MDVWMYRCIYLSISIHWIIPPLFTKDLRWHWLNYRITANICIVLFHWSKLLHVILIMVLWGEYPVSHFTDGLAGSQTHIRNVGLRMEAQISGLYPCSFTSIMPSNLLVTMIKYDMTELFFIFCTISQKLELLFSNWNWRKINIYYYKHNGDLQNWFSLGFCTVSRC